MLEALKVRRNKNERRMEVQRQLDSHKCARRVSFGQPTLDDDLHSVALLLQDLGPVFSSFGLYLSTRPDLLPLQDCLTFAAMDAAGPVTAADEVRDIISRELNSGLNAEATTNFVKFEPDPFESRILYQLHYGELSTGDQVVIKVMHPNLRIEEELDFFTMIRHLVDPRIPKGYSFFQVVEEFRKTLLNQCDCLRTAESLETVANDCRDNRGMSVPNVFREMCSSNVLVTERLAGTRLDKYLRQSTDSKANAKSSSPAPQELARLICDIWLMQTFDGGLMPVDVRPENILIRSPTEVALLDGTFVSLPSVARPNLLDYLISVATEEPGKAMTAILKELDGDGVRISRSQLDRKFRQVVPFRDGGWDDEGKSNCLSDTLFVQWRMVAEAGYSPPPYLVHFYRAAFSIVSTTRRIAPDSDSLDEGVKDFRLKRLLQDISTVFEPSYWGEQSDKLLSLMVIGPQYLDEALKSMQLNREPVDSTVVGTSFFRLGAFVLIAFVVSSHIQESAYRWIGPIWAERLAGVTFLLLGGLFLREQAAGKRL